VIANDNLRDENELLSELNATEEITMPNEIHSYAELQRRIHQDLRVQHPEWVEPNGESPICDSYELRLAELLGLTQSPNAARMQPLPFLGHAGDY
jgi:hypothetical protein